MLVENDNKGFTPVPNKRKKKNNNRRKNKHNKKKGLWGSSMINWLGIGNGNKTSEDSASSTGTEEDGTTTHKSSDANGKEQDFGLA